LLHKTKDDNLGRLLQLSTNQPCIAMRSGGVLSWLLSDHLGGTAHTLSGTTETGEVCYKAFGTTRFTSGTTPTTYRFTGQREEATLGLYYYNARWYDPALGHFLAPDSIVPAAGNALDYHRYAYVRFNPLKYIDPFGHCVFGLDTVVCAIAAAAAIGAAANATGNAVGQFIEQYDANQGFLENLQSTQIDGQKVAIAAGWGAVGGGAAPVTGPLGFVAANAFAGAGQKVTTDVMVNGKPLDEAVLDPNTAIAAGIGAIGAKVGGQVPKVPSYVASNGEEILYATGVEAVVFGGKGFAHATGRMLLSQQVESSLAPRAAAAAAITNLPYSIPQGCTNPWDCLLQSFGGGAVGQSEPCTVDLNDEH
jgi:RHS repeat-associated protein